jgi:probable phosphoglycerate mutase
VIYLVRHGETIWNEAGRQQGQLDSPLTAKGNSQAQAVGRTLRHILQGARGVLIESSSLGRARQTALLIGAELGIHSNEIRTSPLLMEHKLGVWEGLTYAEIDQRYPGARQEREANKWSYVIEGGESYALATDRARQWLATCTAPLIIAVTHEMMSRAIQGAYAALSPQEILGRSHRHDQLYRLHDGKITEVGAASS